MSAMEAIEFAVDGVPIPQGSKTAFVVGKRAVVTDANKGTLKPWRALVTAAALDALARSFQDPLEGAIDVEVVFSFVRPKSVPLTRVYPSVKPDVDKLARAVLDGLTDSGLFRDDAQVVRLVATKVYASTPGARVIVSRMAGQK